MTRDFTRIYIYIHNTYYTGFSSVILLLLILSFRFVFVSPGLHSRHAHRGPAARRGNAVTHISIVIFTVFSIIIIYILPSPVITAYAIRHARALPHHTHSFALAAILPLPTPQPPPNMLFLFCIFTPTSCPRERKKKTLQ